MPPRKKPRKRRSDFAGRTRIVTLKLTEAEYEATAAAAAAAEPPVTVSAQIRTKGVSVPTT